MSEAGRLHANPVLRRELLERWRGRRAMLVVTLYVALLSAFTLLLAWIGIRFLDRDFGFDAGITGAGPLLGRFLVENLLAGTLGLALLLAPAYAATQLSGERERKTLALLRITLVSPRQIVLGKLGAATAWLLLLVLAAVPLMGLGFFLGGLTMPQLLRGIFTLLALTVSIAALGIGISSVMQRSTPALVVTILTVGALTVGTLFGGLIEGAARDFRFDGGRPVSTLVNPFVALADAVDADENRFFGGGRLDSLLTAFGSLLPQEENRVGFAQRGFDVGFDEDFAVADSFIGEPGFGPGFGFDEGVRLDGPQIIEVEEPGAGRPYWLLTSAFYLVLGLLALVVAARRVAREDIE